MKDEEDIPAQKTAPQERTWLSQADEDQKRQKSFGLKKAEGQSKAHPLIQITIRK